MSTAKSLHLPASQPVRFEYMIKINDYDRVTSFLIALNMLMGLAVAILLLMWLSTIDIQRIAPIPVIMVPPKPPGDNPKGYEEDVEAPGLEEVQDFTEPRIEETFLAVTDLVTATSGALVALNTGATSSSHGSGMGDKRSPGGTGGGGGEDYSDRWRVNITALNIGSFARILDSFSIECVVFGGGVKTFDYARNLSDTAPTAYSREKADARGVYDPSDANARLWTRELCEKAGIPVQGRFPTHAYPIVLNQKLTALEFASATAAGKQMDEVRRTTFEVRGTGGAFEFYVTKQEYKVVARRQ
ncbi:MAG: hypothetical protein VX761_08860 [Planctomycetota bacterium]|nr:hypothetical protein [Planctomycetota bacterium]